MNCTMKQLQLYRSTLSSLKELGYKKPLSYPALFQQRRPPPQRFFHQTTPKMDAKSSPPSTSTSTSPISGYFQTITFSPHPSSSTEEPRPRPLPTSITITDAIYGTHTLTSTKDPLLITLLQSPYLTRLSGVNQHGITGLLGLTPPITRLEHSVGAFLLVRSLGASMSEQVAALLHDVSHTALSHVVDWALPTSPGGGSYHEVHKTRYLSMSDLPGIVRRFASSLHVGREEENKKEEEGYMIVFEEEKFPLVEYPAPHLCADRIDYALRDSLAFGKLNTEEVKQVFESFRAFPSADGNVRERRIVMGDVDLALKFARAYNGVDRDVWSNPANVDMYRVVGGLIGDAVRGGKLEGDDLWRLSDGEFWEVLRRVTDDEGRLVMAGLERDGLKRGEDGEVMGLPVGTKVRTLDPDVLVSVGGGGGYRVEPLSVVCPAWGVERGDYISARKRLIGLSS